MAMDKEQWALVWRGLDEKARKAGISTIEYLMRTLCHVLDSRVNPPVRALFIPNPVQERIIRELWYLNVIPKARQHGVSTVVAMIIFILCLTRKNFRCAIIDETDDKARKKLAMIKYAYDHMSDEDGPGAALGQQLKEGIVLTKESQHELEWANGSSVVASTSVRGGTFNFLWISELGKIAMDFPAKAQEIMAGSLESVHPGNFCIVESTHEGGRHGEFYRLIRLAQKSPPVLKAPYDLTKFKLMFFPWHENPSYVSAFVAGGFTPEMNRYFDNVEKACGKKLTNEQRQWYVNKAAVQMDMAHQYPGTLEEALQAVTEGAIYGDQIALLRSTGRVCDFGVDGNSPCFTCWDLGVGDATGVWLLQIVSSDIHALAFHCANGGTAGQHAAVVMEWARLYRVAFSAHYLPHDADNRGPSGKSWRDLLTDAGLHNIVTVPRTPDVWVGINYLRSLLPRFRFHSACERVFELPFSRVWPSGIGALEGYRKKVELVGGAQKSLPVHDECEAGASSLRTFAEAHARGMLTGTSRVDAESRISSAPVRALTGLRKRPNAYSR